MKHDVPGFEETNTINGQAFSQMLGAAHYWKEKYDNLKSLKAPSRKLILFVFLLGIITGGLFTIIAQRSFTLSIWTPAGLQNLDDNRTCLAVLEKQLSISPMLDSV
jgi:hypothetical protein